MSRRSTWLESRAQPFLWEVSLSCKELECSGVARTFGNLRSAAQLADCMTERSEEVLENRFVEVSGGGDWSTIRLSPQLGDGHRIFEGGTVELVSTVEHVKDSLVFINSCGVFA